MGKTQPHPDTTTIPAIFLCLSGLAAIYIETALITRIPLPLIPWGSVAAIIFGILSPQLALGAISTYTHPIILILSALEILAAYWLRKSQRKGATLAITLITINLLTLTYLFLSFPVLPPIIAGIIINTLIILLVASSLKTTTKQHSPAHTNSITSANERTANTYQPISRCPIKNQI